MRSEAKKFKMSDDDYLVMKTLSELGHATTSRISKITGLNPRAIGHIFDSGRYVWCDILGSTLVPVIDHGKRDFSKRNHSPNYRAKIWYSLGKPSKETD